MIPLPIYYTELESIYAKTFGAGLNTLAVTGTQDGEGVSTLAYALARRAAAMGGKTLLVDTNMRNGSVGRRLGISPKQWTFKEPPGADKIVALSNTGLSVLPAPVGFEDGTMARETVILRACMQRWLKTYDFVVADTSPMTIRNQANVPPENVCAACEGTILVVLTGQTSENRILEAQGKLSGANAQLVGTVLNDKYAPTLSDELVRETHRFDSLLPGTMAKLRAFILRSHFLNQAI